MYNHKSIEINHVLNKILLELRSQSIIEIASLCELVNYSQSMWFLEKLGLKAHEAISA